MKRLMLRFATRPLLVLVSAAAFLSVATLMSSPAMATGLPVDQADVFINEFHYDNLNADQNEGVEVAGPAGLDLSAYSIELYNGYDQKLYGTVGLSGVLPDQQNGFGTRFFTVPGLQNGAPDGLALVGPMGVIETLGYEGTFAAINGSAAGRSLVDIGRFEPPSTPVGESLQLHGTGDTAADFSWGAPTSATPNALNANEHFVEPGTPVATAPPTNTTPPTTSGTGNPGAAENGEILSCATGAWTADPVDFTFLWTRDGTPIPGATQSTHTVVSSDEGQTLACTVTAITATGATVSATSPGTKVTVPFLKGCPRATGRLHGRTIGRVSLGMTRAHARSRYQRYVTRGRGSEDVLCLTPLGIRVGYPSITLLSTLKPKQRRRVQGRAVLVLTANAYYAVHGIRTGATIAAARKKLKSGAALHVGRSNWYIGRAGASTAILKVRHGIVVEVGIANRELTDTRPAQRSFLKSFQ